MWTKTLGFEMGRGRKESETICCFLGFLMQVRTWQRHALGCGSMSHEKGSQHPFPILTFFVNTVLSPTADVGNALTLTADVGNTVTWGNL